ncbi:RagB/SusD family nutrient uptake outer membrane protein [Prevotella sp. oral taxon 299]|uniref:RagB/SusD family nutrient uptake outer membrane protein n=1 Tax=Prevotella sp. oral taxon 299 TaxID=652716 RepID=UPI0001C3F695|nr:RagB/SusD family nutrient uptake outer membrane protein [Prevotella sp. oral taxon 299]EFC71489.1 hypothetical protein HMPREF0669_00161 [Prevotella sp. oral taxon 299 str. F0039]
MNKYFKHIIPSAIFLFSTGILASCVGDLDVTPIDPNIRPTANGDALFNKCYANIAVAGNGGATGDCDIDGLDGGTTGFVRQMWNSNELTTDEAICHWGDAGIEQFDYNTYDASHPMLNGYFARLTTGITYCNDYLKNINEDATKTAEIRFVRALEYYLLMDAFGNVPFAETLSEPTMKTRPEMYEWLVKELTEIEPNLSEAQPKKSSDANYGRVDKASAWMLLARLYLNAQVYTGTPQWAKAAEYAKKIMDSAYKLNTKKVNGWSAYQMLFMGDNGETDAAYEAIFPILQDGLKTTSWGTTTFLTASTFDGNMHASIHDKSVVNGLSGQTWGGNRCRPDLLKRFFPNKEVPNVSSIEMPTKDYAHDDRAIFDGKDRKLDNGKGAIGKFTDGFATAKFINIKTDGSAGHSLTFSDADFFFFRKAEAYLIYAEATARANGNHLTPEGIAAVKTLRERANAEPKTNFTLSELCDEWSREFYFEGIRRPTLIRFGFFGGDNNYNWTYKGGVKEGRSFSASKNIFAIPSNYVKDAIKQNPNY